MSALMSTHNFQRAYFRLPISGWLLILVCVIWGATSKNPALTSACILIVPYFINMLWRKGEPLITLYVILFQWMEVSTLVFYANFLKLPVSRMSPAFNLEQAVWMGLSGLFVLTLGFRLGLARLNSFDIKKETSGGSTANLKNTFSAYLASLIFSLFCRIAASSLGGLKQVFLVLADVKWAFFFLFAYSVLSSKRNVPLLILATSIEIIIGLTGFFSGFKQVFFILIITYFALNYKLTFKSILMIAVIIVPLLYLSVGWMAVREDYRDFLNQGTGQQVVDQPLKERILKIHELFTSLNSDKLKDSVDDLISRVAYVEYFAYVLDYVPKVVPYQEGQLWLKAIRHILIPRLFWPGKPILPSESESTMEYTGLRLASAEQGTEISMGYMAESYIDFGPIGMYVPIFFIGILYGNMYTLILRRARFKLYGLALSILVLLHSNQFGISGIKLLGGVITSLLAVLIFQSLSESYIRNQLFSKARVSA